MKPDREDPRRWSEGPRPESSPQSPSGDALGAALRRARALTEPTDVEVAAVRRRLAALPRQLPSMRLWRVALAAGLLIAMGGGVGAALKKWLPLGARVQDAPSAPATEPVHLRERRRHGPPPAAPVWAPPAADEGAPLAVADAPSVVPPVVSPVEVSEAVPGVGPTAASSSPPVPVAPVRRLSQLAGREVHPPVAPRRAEVGPTVASLDVPAGSEAAEIATAFRQLRSAGDPAAALRALDRYQADHPTGALRGEARVARAEALIELGRRREALPLLDEMDGRSSPLTRNVRLTRAELHAEAGQCLRARADFDVLADGDERDDIRARALYGRASCRLGAGDTAGARLDLETYLRMFPGGTFAPAARRALDFQR